jgi:hypothetical protein
MNKFTLSVLMGIINMDAIREDDMGIQNMLYGLCDGYDYTDAIMERAKDKFHPITSEYKMLDALCEEVKSYPDGQTQLF